MLTALLILIGDLALGAAAYRLAKSNDVNGKVINKILENHEVRIINLEKDKAA